MKVVIVGSGNVATVLGKKIVAAGHEVLEVISRSSENASWLASQLNANSNIDIKKITTDGDIYLLCVSDDLIETISHKIPFTHKLIVHTAGAVSKNVLANHQNFGVLYPLQSLRKEMERVPEIPVLIDGSSQHATNEIFEFAKTWALSVSVANDAQRLKLHVAAVVASNFTNHLFAMTEAFCQSENVDFKTLLPLIQETTARLNFSSPSKLQTGPASRNDVSTINKHLEILSAYPNLADLYNRLSNSIMLHSSAKHETNNGRR